MRPIDNDRCPRLVANLAGSPQEAMLELGGVEAVAPGSSLRVALGPHSCRWLALTPQVADLSGS